MPSATVDLQQEVDDLKAKVRELSKTPEEREEEAKQRWIDHQIERDRNYESPAAAFMRQERERIQRQTEDWLHRCGVPADASEETKELALKLTCRRSQAVFALLIASIAGKKMTPADAENASVPELLATYRRLTPEVQLAVNILAGAYAFLRSQAQIH